MPSQQRHSQHSDTAPRAAFATRATLRFRIAPALPRDQPNAK